MKLSAEGIPIAPDEGFKGFGKLGLEGTAPGGASITFKDFISSVIGVMTIIAIIWFIFSFITGAISYMTAGGDKAAVEGARKRIINSIIGFVVVVSAIFVIRLIGLLIGIPDLLNIPALIGRAGDLVIIQK